MKKLYIIGARGFGREVYELATQTLQFRKEFEIAGFLDDKADALMEFQGYPAIISSVEAFYPTVDDVFICALGDVNYKKIYTEIILEKGGVFINLIHPSAYISPNAKLGKGCIVCAYTRISCDTQIGNYNTFQPFCAVGHDAIIENYNHFNTYSFLGGGVKVGNLVTLHTGSIVHPHKIVADKSIIGAGAVVLRNVKENITLYGNPAKKLNI